MKLETEPDTQPKKEAKPTPKPSALWECEVIVKELKIDGVIAYSGAKVKLGKERADSQAAEGNVRMLRPIA